MIEEHCYQPGDQVQSGNHVYRLERFDDNWEWWVVWREQDSKLMHLEEPFTYVKHIGMYLGEGK